MELLNLQSSAGSPCASWDDSLTRCPRQDAHPLPITTLCPAFPGARGTVLPAIPGTSLNPEFLGLYHLCFRKHVCHNVALIPTTALFDVGGCKGHEGAQITQTSVRQCPVKQATKRFC